MNRLLAPALVLLALVSPASAGDLSGLWDVRGELADGRSYTAQAAVSPGRKAGTYRIMGRGKLGSRALVWRANAKRQGSTLHVRHIGHGGLVGRLTGSTGKRVVGTYTVDADERGFGGSLGVEGESKQGTVRFTRLKLPTASFSPTSLSLAVGKRGVVEVTTDPPEATGLLWFEGPVERAFWEEGKRKIEVSGDAVGTHTLKARLGSLTGKVVAELKLTVGPSVLDRIVDAVKQAKADGKTPVVIFDLDDTLFDTRYRVRDILRDYGKTIDEPRLKTLSVRHVVYLLPKTLARAGFTQAEIEGDLGKKINAAWRKRMWLGASHSLDRPMRGARRYAERLVAAGAELHFITGRKQSDYTASLEKLAEDAFPEGTLHCKPNNFYAGTPAFKKEATQKLRAKPNVTIVAAIDNEPGNCTAFKQAAPKATVVWIRSQWKEMPKTVPMAPGVIEIPRGYR